MTEKHFILSTQKNAIEHAAVMPKTLLMRVMDFFTERFDAITAVLSKWTKF